MVYLENQNNMTKEIYKYALQGLLNIIQTDWKYVDFPALIRILKSLINVDEITFL